MKRPQSNFANTRVGMGGIGVLWGCGRGSHNTVQIELVYYNDHRPHVTESQASELLHATEPLVLLNPPCNLTPFN